MKQHLVTLTVIGLAFFVASGGCSSTKKKKTTASDLSQPIPANSFAQKWFYPVKLQNDTVSELHLRGDRVFVYTKAHLVYILGSEGGEFRRFSEPDVSGGVLRPPVILGEHVLYPSGSTLDIFNNLGRLVRTITLEKPTRSGAVGDGKTIYLGLDHPGGTGVVASIDITKPYRVINWELMTFGAVTPTPAMFDRTIYAGAEDGQLYAVSEERGQIWPLENGTFKTSGKFVSDIVADDYGVYASNTDSKLYCLDRISGKIKWQYYSGVALKTAPVVTSTMVYQLVPGSGIVAIDKANGTFNRGVKWSKQEATQVLCEDQANVYLRRQDNHLMAVDKASGELKFVSRGAPFDVFTTNTTSPIIYAASKDGKVYAVKPVLAEGEVGHIVLDFRAEPLAVAR